MSEFISLIISAIAMIISSIIFGIIMLEPKRTKITIKKIIAILIVTIIYTLEIKYLEGTVKSLSLCCLYGILFIYLFKTTTTKAILLTFLYSVLIIIPDIIYLFFSLYVLKIDQELFYTNFTGTILASVVVSMLFVLMVYITRKWLRKLVNLKIDNNKLIVIYIILTLGCILLIFYESFLNVKLNGELLLSTAVMIVFVIILYSLIRQKIENNKIIEKYDKLLEFIKKYEIEIEEQKQIRHESKNQLITIKGRIVNKVENSAIISYIDSLLNDYTSYDEEKYSKFQYLPANGIKGLFYYKAMEAEEKGIELSINIASRVEKSELSKLSTEEFKQLGRLIGVYIDNAIEASILSKDKKLGIEAYVHKNEVVIVISNTYEGEIEEENIGKTRYSTKGKNRGYGLMLVNKIINSSNKFVSERTITKDLYIQKIIIKK